jgi:hypothetical protein
VPILSANNHFYTLAQKTDTQYRFAAFDSTNLNYVEYRILDSSQGWSDGGYRIVKAADVKDTYDAQSGDPQSGKAVAQAVSDRVPTTRTVNNKALSSNISLGASDIGAVTQLATAQLGSGTDWSSARSKYLEVPKNTIAFQYNTNGAEETLLYSAGTTPASWGSILRWGNYSNYMYIGHFTSGQGLSPSTGWEKISAGYADNAGTADSANSATKDGNGNTISSTYLKLSGGNMAGSINARANMYEDDAVTNGINMNNSNIVSVNSIYTADTSDGASEGIHFYRDSTHYDSLWMNGGNIYFAPNRALGTNTSAANSKKVAVLPASFSSGKAVVTDGTSGSIKTVDSVPQANYATSAGSATDAFKKSTSAVVHKTLSDITPSSSVQPIETFGKENRIVMAFFYIKNSSQSSTCNFKISLVKTSDNTTVFTQNINLAAYQLVVVPMCVNTSESEHKANIVQLSTTVAKLYIKGCYVSFRY